MMHGVEANTEPKHVLTPQERTARLKAQVLTSAEGRVLMAGVVLALLYALWLVSQLLVSVEHFGTLFAITAAKIVVGRAACIALGYSLGLSHAQVIIISMVVQTIQILIFYPMLVFIWRQLLVIKWLQKTSDRIHTAAQAHQQKIHQYGVPGLFVFVCIPFWLTGPIVGCMVGYLMGLSVRVTLATVLTGSYAAIVIWSAIIYHVHQKALAFGSCGFWIVALLAGATLLAWSLRKRIRQKQRGIDGESPSEP